MNLGKNPRVLGVEGNAKGFGMPRVCRERSFLLPSHSMALMVRRYEVHYSSGVRVDGALILRGSGKKRNGNGWQYLCMCNSSKMGPGGFGASVVQGLSAKFNGSSDVCIELALNSTCLTPCSIDGLDTSIRTSLFQHVILFAISWNCAVVGHIGF